MTCKGIVEIWNVFLIRIKSYLGCGFRLGFLYFFPLSKEYKKIKVKIIGFVIKKKLR